MEHNNNNSNRPKRNTSKPAPRSGRPERNTRPERNSRPDPEISAAQIFDGREFSG